MRVYNIVWETDGEKVDLPSEVDVPNDLEEYDVADYLSDEYGWLVITFDCDDFDM